MKPINVNESMLVRKFKSLRPNNTIWFNKDNNYIKVERIKIRDKKINTMQYLMETEF